MRSAFWRAWQRDRVCLRRMEYDNAFPWQFVMISKSLPVSPLALSPRITCLPVVHGSGACALAVRRWLLEHPCDCLAVALPESFRYGVLDAVQSLPSPAIVLQRPLDLTPGHWQSEQSSQSSGSEEPAWSYVPIDPCQPVIMALRVAMGERWPIEFCDLETAAYQPIAAALPDAYALKTVSLERFATAVLPGIARPYHAQAFERLQYQAWRLKQLEQHYRHIVVVGSILEWPWLREAYHEQAAELPLHDSVEVPTTYAVNPNSLLFLFGELPFITGLYEQARVQLEDDEDLAIDGVKQLLMSARSSYLQDFGKRARRITPLMLAQCLKYIRNLTLLERRLTPDMYTIGLAAQQILGDQYAIHVIEAARGYPFGEQPGMPEATMGIDQARLPGDETVCVVSRLPGQPISWRRLELRRKPARHELEQWQMRWNPFSQCSWPPEDKLIESFRTRVADRAQALIGADLAEREIFDQPQGWHRYPETLRHWYDGDYVKVMPPSVGVLDCVVMIFDSPGSPRVHLADDLVRRAPERIDLGFLCDRFQSGDGGAGHRTGLVWRAMFLFPPVSVPDIWRDPRLDFAVDLEQRLLAAACLHSRQRRIALLSPTAPELPGGKLPAAFAVSSCMCR